MTTGWWIGFVEAAHLCNRGRSGQRPLRQVWRRYKE